MPEKNFYHQDGVIYPSGEVRYPVGITYDKKAEIEYEIVPQIDLDGSIEISLAEPTPMDHNVATEGFDTVQLQDWPEDLPIQVKYTVDTEFQNLREADHVKSGMDRKEVEAELGPDFISNDAEEFARRIEKEFTFGYDFDTLDGEEFLENKEGVCDHFSELMSLGDDNWIKHNGYARQGDHQLPERNLDFGKHAWVVDTEKGAIYDPTTVLSSNTPASQVELPADVYFVQLPKPSISIDGENLARKKISEEDGKEIRYILGGKID